MNMFETIIVYLCIISTLALILYLIANNTFGIMYSSKVAAITMFIIFWKSGTGTWSKE